ALEVRRSAKLPPERVASLDPNSLPEPGVDPLLMLVSQLKKAEVDIRKEIHGPPAEAQPPTEAKPSTEAKPPAEAKPPVVKEEALAEEEWPGILTPWRVFASLAPIAFARVEKGKIAETEQP